MIVVFPMTGALLYDDKEYLYPKPLIEMGSKTMLEGAIQAYYGIENVSFKFVLREEDDRRYKLGAVIKQAAKGFDVDVVTVPDRTAGSLCSAMLALADAEQTSEVIISNYDQILKANVQNYLDFFRKKNADFGLITFDSVHPKWSYVRLNDKGNVCEAAEKRPISRFALCGIYYFGSVKDFVDSASRVLLSASPSQEVFFISESINQLVLDGKKGVAKTIDRDSYVNFYDSHTLSYHLSKELSSENELYYATEDYARAFDCGDVSQILDFFSDDASLADPVNNLKGKCELEKFLIMFFETNQDVSFLPKQILVKHNTSIIHFTLSLQSDVFEGVDVIVWKDGLIKSIDAYLSEISNEEI